MGINLIDSLLEEKPIIDYESNRINSNFLLSDVLGYDIGSSDKMELVNFPSYLDELTHIIWNGDRPLTQYPYFDSGSTYISYNNLEIWNELKLPIFVISKKLLHFLMYESSLYLINKIFNLNFSLISNNRDRVVECFNMIVDKFNYLIEDENGYLLYGQKKSKIRYGKFIKMIVDMFCEEDCYNHKMTEIENSVNNYKSKFSTKGYMNSSIKSTKSW
jgi:hypothetical protein